MRAKAKITVTATPVPNTGANCYTMSLGHIERKRCRTRRLLSADAISEYQGGLKCIQQLNQGDGIFRLVQMANS